MNITLNRGLVVWIYVYLLTATHTLAFEANSRTGLADSTYIEISDSAFEQYLLNEGFDSEQTLDGRILKVDVERIDRLGDTEAGQRSMSGLNIHSLEGIQLFSNLVYLDCSNNIIRNLDLCGLESLQELHVSFNRLYEVKLGLKDSLKVIDLSNNTLVYLDFSNMPNLSWIDVSNNRELLWLNVANGRNQNIEYLDTRGNVRLNCIQVDDRWYAHDHWENIERISDFRPFCFELERITPISVCVSNEDDSIAIPDTAFESYLIDRGYDRDYQINGLISEHDALLINVLGSRWPDSDLSMLNRNIASLKGIESFANLQELYLSGLSSFDIDPSHYKRLRLLYCAGLNIDKLDLSANYRLEYLDCGDNLLGQLDLSNCPYLKVLACQENQLSELDLSQNSKLEQLYAFDNQLKTLDVSDLALLSTLMVGDNELTHITGLESDVLKVVQLDNNQLDHLDFSNASELTILTCTGNELHALNLANGHNDNIRVLRLNDNPNLSCIQVDSTDKEGLEFLASDSCYLLVNVKDESASYSMDCNGMVSAVEINNAQWDEVSVYPNPFDNMIYIKLSKETSLRGRVMVYDITGRKLKEKELSSSTYFNQSDLPAGLYIIEIEYGNKSIRKKIVKP